MPRISTEALLKQNKELWETVEFRRLDDSLLQKVATRLVAPKAKKVYKVLEAKTSVPWWVIAVIHEREASQRWNRSLAQGDRWDRVSRNHPAGRGPFKSFIAAGYDALVHCAPYASRWKDWSPGGALTLLGLYNGTGYESYHNMPSPYVWNGTQHYVKGKYVADGKFDPTVVDTQLGCAELLMAMAAIDNSIPFSKTPLVKLPQITDVLDEEPGSEPPDLPKPMSKSKISWLSSILTALGIGGAGTQVNDAIDKLNKVAPVAKQLGLMDHIGALVTNPLFLIFLGIAGVAVTIAYFRWKDHGEGSLF